MKAKTIFWIILAVIFVALILVIVAFYYTYKYRKQDRRSRRKLKESYDQLQLALNAGNISAWIYNLAEKIMFPLSNNQLIHDNAFIQNFLDNIEPSDVHKVEEMINYVAQGNTKLGKVCFQSKKIENESEQYFETKMQLIPASDEHPNLIVGTLKNITDDVMEQKRLIEMKEKAESDNKVKSAILANISHDIRTPLGAIRGFNEILNGEDRDLLEEKDREMYLKIISTNIEIVTTLVQEVLDLAKFESGTYHINYSDVDLEDICRTSIENVRNQVKEGVELKYCNHCKSMTITTDSVRLLQVLSNYLTNACKYTDKGSIELCCECIDNNMRFSVTDTGKGIRPEDAEICFDRFKMLKDSQAGTGLGLHICKLIAEILGGKVYVDTTYTNGAKFVFEFSIK